MRDSRGVDSGQGRVVVLGSINVDLVATAPRFPHPGETVLASGLNRIPGGKGANQAVAASRAEAPTVLVGCVGDDDFGRFARGFLEEEDLDLTHLSVLQATSTGVALITVVPGVDNTIVPVLGANAMIGADALHRVGLGEADVVILQFGVQMDAVREAMTIARDSGARVVLNAAPAEACPPELLRQPDVLVVNETELAMFAVGDPSRATAALPDVTGMVAELGRGDRATVVTLGGSGAVLVVGGGATVVPARATEVVDTTGAGDCFVGNLAARLASGEALEAATRVAVTASSLACERLGAGVAMPTLDETLSARP